MSFYKRITSLDTAKRYGAPNWNKGECEAWWSERTLLFIPRRKWKNWEFRTSYGLWKAYFRLRIKRFVKRA